MRAHLRRPCVRRQDRSAWPGRGARLSAYRRHAGGLETRSSWALNEPSDRESRRACGARHRIPLAHRKHRQYHFGRADRKRGVKGKSVAVRVGSGGRLIIKKKKKRNKK